MLTSIGAASTSAMVGMRGTVGTAIRSTPSHLGAVAARSRASSVRSRNTCHAGVRSPLRPAWRVGLGAVGVVAVFGAWLLASSRLDDAKAFLVPTPSAAWDAFVAMWRDGTFWSDLTASLARVGVGYGISMAIGIVLGVLVTHDVEEAIYLDGRIFVMSPRPGRIAEEVVVPFGDRAAYVLRDPRFLDLRDELSEMVA